MINWISKNIGENHDDFQIFKKYSSSYFIVFFCICIEGQSIRHDNYSMQFDISTTRVCLWEDEVEGWHLLEKRVAPSGSHSRWMTEQGRSPQNIQHRGSIVDGWTRNPEDEPIILVDEDVQIAFEDVKGQNDKQMVTEIQVPYHSDTEAPTDTKVTPQHDIHALYMVDIEVTPPVETKVTAPILTSCLCIQMTGFLEGILTIMCPLDMSIM